MDIDYTVSSEDLFKISDTLKLKAEETAEAFIFSTIYPFAQNQTQMVISKKFLVDAIRKQTPSAVVTGEGWGLDRCPVCSDIVNSDFIYCPKCGQLLTRERKVYMPKNP